MREIIFRGQAKNGMWFYGYLTKTQDFYTIQYENIEGFYFEELVNPETVGQFTGLTDINGQRIFEGDIVKTHYANSIKADFVEEVVFYSGGFCAMYKLQDGGMYSKLADGCLPCGNVPYMDRAEVIGNIYDNPELLEDCK